MRERLMAQFRQFEELVEEVEIRRIAGQEAELEKLVEQVETKRCQLLRALERKRRILTLEGWILDLAQAFLWFLILGQIIYNGDFRMLGGYLAAMSGWKLAAATRRSLSGSDPDGWVRAIAVLVPRRYREALIGDILEDRHEWRAQGKRRLWIELLTLWHLLHAPRLGIAVVLGWFARRLSE